jgi:hypothetical protein
MQQQRWWDRLVRTMESQIVGIGNVRPGRALEPERRSDKGFGVWSGQLSRLFPVRGRNAGRIYLPVETVATLGSDAVK